MVYVRDNSLSTAAAVVSDRIRQHPHYQAAQDLVLERAYTRVLEYDRDVSVAAMRRLGGLTEVVEYAIATLPDLYRQDLGSKMFPRAVADELRADVGRLRSGLQQRLAAYLAARR